MEERSEMAGLRSEVLETIAGPSMIFGILGAAAAGAAAAYGFSMSSQYNSRPRAAEVLVDGPGFRIVRERESFLDIIRHER